RRVRCRHQCRSVLRPLAGGEGGPPRPHRGLAPRVTPHLGGAGAFACQLAEAEDEVRVLLRSYRHLGPGRDDNFSLFASDTIVNLWERLTGAISGMAIGIVSVFMIVGGIVIMNIMLAVFTERTQEIGIRKSLGARRPRHPQSIPGGIERAGRIG